MRWTETPPAGPQTVPASHVAASSASPPAPAPSADGHSDDGSPAVASAGTRTDAEVVAAALGTHQAMLRTVEDAHHRAASSWESGTSDDASATARNGRARSLATGAGSSADAAAADSSARPTDRLRRAHAQAHRLRADEHRQRHEFLDQISSIAPSAVSALGAQDLEALTVPAEIGAEALHTPARQLQDALEASQGLPDGELGISRPKLPVRVGLIASPRVHARFTGLADVVGLTGGTWRELLDDLDLLLVATDTGPLPLQWEEALAADPEARALLETLDEAEEPGERQALEHALALRHLAQTVIPAFRGRGIPTVLLSTAGTDIAATGELARACSRIVTTDAEAAALYRAQETESISVDVVPAGVNPLIHSPLGTRPARTDLVALLGCEQSHPAPHLSRPPYAPALLDGALISGRPAVFLQPDPSQAPGSEHWVIPTRYGPWTISADEAADIDLTYGTESLQRGMDVALAINAVVGSQAVFDPQVLELQACGTMVIATYNQGLNSYHPHTYIANSAEDVAKTLQLTSREELRRVQADGIRKVFTDHHASDVLRRICARAGLEVAPVRERVLAVTTEHTTALAREMAEQSHGEVELITWEELERRITAEGAETVAAELDVLLPVSADRQHSPTYVADHVAAFRYQSAAVTQKLVGDAAATDAQAHRHRTGVVDLDLTAWWRPEPTLLSSVESLHQAAEQERVYCLDHLGHHRARRISGSSSGEASSGTKGSPGTTMARPSFWEVVRGEAHTSRHTPTVMRRRGDAARPSSAPSPSSQSSPTPSAGSTAVAPAPGSPAARPRRPLPDPHQGDDLPQVQEQARRTAEELDLKLAVVVPIYNNGDHLRHKAFASLRRSSVFEQMHILLVDDGSTDPATVDTVEELAHDWPHVTAYHHARGGSGSASRPRNTGLALSFTPYVTYLDPDDEELDDGYWELMERLEEEPDADFALGTMAVWTSRRTVHDYHAWFAGSIPHRDGLFRVDRDTLPAIGFRPASIEALVARTAWLKSLQLVQPEGAVGQDTYFFQQLLYHTRAYAPVYRPVYTYYGAVDTSIVNVVSPKYFRKYLILEQARSAWLRETGLLEAYMEQRFESFFVTWYLSKYKRVLPHERQEAAAVLREIADAYGEYSWTSPKARSFIQGQLD
ncbi:glycosyltransferase [Nesterenkonia sp. HG001]|uniref:glycosyltransferase n=1 Tax=Nesterenkonia sp. HG001 TaxID=2983207 RepID=UPI002AC79E29|nr:glycosyltransferase [Nesterenkonia sp. HG001]MDZ5078536.1 glycosyltransferase [Nesterenkonia sp. HG001]